METGTRGVIDASHMPDTTHPYCHTCCTNEHASGPCPMAREDDRATRIERIAGTLFAHANDTDDEAHGMRLIALAHEILALHPKHREHTP